MFLVFSHLVLDAVQFSPLREEQRIVISMVEYMQWFEYEEQLNRP